MLGGLDESIVTILEFAGIVAFAASGSLLAVRKDFDLIGVLALGTATALGGDHRPWISSTLVIAGKEYLFQS